MNTQQSEDLFEFVDYTSVSNFERLVTFIEDVLIAWEVKDGLYGVFSDDHLEKAQAALSEPSAATFTRHETFNQGDQHHYTFTYHCYPKRINTASTCPLSSDDYYDFLNPPYYHALHRWTGQQRFFILTTNVTDQAKYLISACAIAFQNTGCTVPVFVPTKTKHQLFIGYMLISDQPSHPLNETEIRMNMALYPSSTKLSSLEGLVERFKQKVVVYREDYGESDDIDQNDILTSVSYTYSLKNWFDEHWKGNIEDIIIEQQQQQLEDEKAKEKKRHSFSDDFESWDEPDQQQQQQQQQQQLQKQRQIKALPFGSFNDPLRELALTVVFPFTPSPNLMLFNDDNTFQTTLKNNKTKDKWLLSREFAPKSQQRAFLSGLLGQVIKSWMMDPSNANYSTPFDRMGGGGGDNDIVTTHTNERVGLVHSFLTAVQSNRNAATSPSTSSVVSNTSNATENGKSDQVTVIRSEQVENVMNAVFESEEEQDGGGEEKRSQMNPVTQKLVLSLKSASAVPCGSLLWNVMFYSLEALSKNNTTSPIGFLKIIWTELLKKVRWHWKHLIPLPDLEPFDAGKEQTIDLRFNIIHQKLVMINCCIHRKLKEPSKKDQKTARDLLESKSSTSSSFEDNHHSDDSTDDDDSDIFYDSIQDNDSQITTTNNNKKAEEQPEMVSRTASLTDLSETATTNHLPMTESFVSLPYTPGNDIDPYSGRAYDDKMEIKDPEEIEGVLHQHESLLLLKTNKPMNIPITQEPGIMTEDMLQLQAEKFESLGSSDNATQLRAKLQSAQLYSDMQAFKAANPQACLEDFVRWHSPRDWTDGQLSARMSETNNIWQELWKCSKRIPCIRQKPLFDASGEAEKALSDLEKTSIHEFFAIMLPTIGLIAYDSLASHPIVNCISPVSLGMDRLKTELVSFRWNDFCEGKVPISSLISSIRQQESMMCYAISLLRKLPKQYNLVSKLLMNVQDTVDEAERSAVFQLFKNEHDVIAEPSFREYLVYSDMKLNERCLPLRQYALVKDNEIRVVDLQTTDAIYF